MAATIYIGGYTTTAATTFAGGVTGVAGRGPTYRVTFGGTWARGDQYTLDIVTPSVTYVAGVGNITGIQPVALLTLNDRVHAIAGSRWYGCDNGDPTQWEEQAPGAFFIDCSNNFKAAETLVSLAAYQGRMALFSNNTVQIWNMDANPANFSVQQILANIGAYCPLGPQSIGDLDVIFPSLTGFRSLRVRDSSDNAFVNDLGSAVDRLVQADMQAVGFSNLATNTCSIVEPTANRYWHYINGKIYVLSYFPAAKIYAAWSQYTPSYYASGTLTTFTPLQFVLANNQVLVLATVAGTKHVFSFGYAYNSNNFTYDVTVAQFFTSWLDLGSPAIRKQVESLDYAITGTWQMFGNADYYGFVNNAGTMTAITNAAVGNSSYQLGEQAWSESGFNIRLGATTAYNGYAVFSAFVLHYSQQDEK